MRREGSVKARSSHLPSACVPEHDE
ncbi:hypothetical protein VDGL01_05321 [Verticillium dahliae]